ncbi:hypothetical protein JYK02_28245 [Corallococcus macrosporus]|uniref:DUF4350 domain-containing protein n=1 Tax=Corallococcus macrosporus TaxID=35 RepID=A0ABS3DJA5_9BACT|nr:hypothetical protein [Corallococcus macrosporus]
MRDRFPLLVLGSLLLAGVLGTFLVRGAQRGGFADPLSTFRAEPDGARALYLLAQESGLPVTRNMADLRLLSGKDALVLLAVEVQDSHEEDPDQTRLASDPDAGVDDEEAPHQGFNALRAQQLDDDEVERVLAHVRAGASLVYVPWGSRENALLDALGVKLDKADVTLPMRTLVPPLPTPYTLGVERVEAKVQAYLRLPEGAVTVLEDERLGFPVAAVISEGAGRVLVVGAPELAMNPALARADNAQFWLSALGAMGPGPFAFDEFHHGFTNERSLVDFARRYGLHFAVAQLLLGVVLWAGALKRFGRPQPPAESMRVGATDALFAMSRLYREGQHHAFAASLISRGLTQQLAPLAGLPSHSTADAVAEGLRSRGRQDLANGLLEVNHQATAVLKDADLQALATSAAHLRERIHPAGTGRPRPGTP